MHIDSLGFRTDLMLLTLQGSEVEDRGDHLVVRTPRNPTFWWGNFLLLSGPPDPGSVPHWDRAFTHALPAAGHRAFGIGSVPAGAGAGAGADGGAAESAAGYDDFAAAGYDVDRSAVMTATEVHAPPHPQSAATYRALDLDDPRERDGAIDLQMANAPGKDPAGHREFLARKMAAMAVLQEAGHGAWFGAFVEGRMLSGMGLFSDGSGVARFQSVDTHPQARGRGLAGTLVHHVSRYGFDELGATTLVMVADPSYLAIDVYRSVGFAATQAQIEIERAGVTGAI